MLCDVGALRRESIRTLERHGVPERHAAILADALLDADMEGVSSHGIRLLPVYIQKIDDGFFTYDEPVAIRQSPSCTVLDARGCMGAVSACAASHIAVEKAREAGVHCIFVRNANTFGMAASYVEFVARQGMIGFACSNAPAAMPCANGTEAMLGTNPLAFACPSRSQGPITIDMATSVAAKSKFELARQNGELLPDGWALDKEGNPTNDPVEGIRGFVLPMSGFKGYGLAMMIDIVAGFLSGSGFLNKVNKFYTAGAGPMNVGQFVCAMNPDIIYDGDFLTDADEYIRTIRNSKARDGEQIVVPGDRRRACKEVCAVNGIDIPVETYKKLLSVLQDSSAVAPHIKKENEVGKV